MHSLHLEIHQTYILYVNTLVQKVVHLLLEMVFDSLPAPFAFFL